MKLENAALHRFLAWSERHMTKRYEILISEQAPIRYFVSFCRMAELLQKKQKKMKKVLAKCKKVC